jgi:gliding motility-associated-like protein
LYIFSPDGIFNVQLIVSTTAGCSDTVQSAVNVLPVPSLAYDFNGCTDSASFMASADMNVTSWVWSCSDTSIFTGQNPSHVFSSEGTYFLTLSATTDSGCVATYSDTISVTPCDDNQIFPPTAPQAFTPDGDGNNDVFIIRGGPFLEYELRIFNEWGNEIFKSNDQNYGWDGTYKNKKQPLGPYVWTYRIVTMNSDEYNERGEVTILK